ncbi:hypothetical protein KFL_000100120 [Klebsormidium nitens]|uniref:Uncharacterized protein n=1 Tax=Klebsormidium nitens TaxID=105231 RepID=A0A1Y1HNQ9_KLENI|nr:hypothetical protein KFL_000100120 [Klebsormidium nitens]|eukprot:GAQ78246.1 hypothetical protein KFL_000100120 [Klebsormidium nitens]
MGSFYSSEKAMLLKKVVLQHLQSQNIQELVRARLEQDLADGHRSKEEAAAEFKKQVVVDRVLQALTNSGAFVSALKPHLRQAQRTCLHLRVLGARAFLGHLHHQDEARDGQVYLSLSFRDQRFTSNRVRCDVDPALEGSFLLDLGLQLETDPRELLTVLDRIHIVALRRTSGGERTVIGTCSLDWRQVLVSGSVKTVAEIADRGRQSKLPTGLLDLSLELVPKAKELLGEEVLQRQLRLERSQEAESTSRFISYAKEWRTDFLRLRDAHKSRPVEMLARAENGDILPVSAFIQPLRGGRSIGSPLEAARFVSLLGVEERRSADSEGLRVWSDSHTFLARGSGSTEDHAVMLCNLLLGFGLDAYVCIGKDGKGRHAWVATLSSAGDVTFWESLTGRRYPQSDPLAMGQCPYRSLGCVFSQERFFANNQDEDSARLASFDFQNGAHWIGLDEAAIATIRKVPRVGFRPASLVPYREEERLETQLKALVGGYRSDRKLSVTWDDDLSHLLMPALVSYEHEHVLGVSSGQEEFQQSIKATVPVGHTFKAFPQQFNHRSATRVFKSLLQEPVFRDIIGSEADGVKLALRVRLSAYAEVSGTSMADGLNCSRNDWADVIGILDPSRITCEKGVPNLGNRQR